MPLFLLQRNPHSILNEIVTYWSISSAYGNKLLWQCCDSPFFKLRVVTYKKKIIKADVQVWIANKNWLNNKVEGLCVVRWRKLRSKHESAKLFREINAAFENGFCAWLQRLRLPPTNLGVCLRAQLYLSLTSENSLISARDESHVTELKSSMRRNEGISKPWKWFSL